MTDQLINDFYKNLSQNTVYYKRESKENLNTTEEQWKHAIEEESSKLIGTFSDKEASIILHEMIKSAKKSIYIQNDSLSQPLFDYEMRSLLFNKVIDKVDVKIFMKPSFENEDLIKFFKKRKQDSIILTDKAILPLNTSFCMVDDKQIWLHYIDTKFYMASSNQPKSAQTLSQIVNKAAYGLDQTQSMTAPHIVCQPNKPVVQKITGHKSLKEIPSHQKELSLG